ncbi:dolichol phosphate-mannose biosynthesis regulatory [Mycena sp. CBHHK59/15]|nr:dolichol phosphate-mannose biosynthesis regulatory [Mycena sp. CBHHK59/15]
MGASDKILGGAMLLAAAVVFTYYTTWAMLLVCIWLFLSDPSLTSFSQPFFDSSSEIHNFFPAREWAVRLPAFILVVGVSAIGAFVGSTIIRENRANSQRARLRTA